MAVQGIDLVSDTTVKELVEQIKYGNALRAAEAADSLATLKGAATSTTTTRTMRGGAPRIVLNKVDT